MAQRQSGVLLHISSLPSPYGIGTLGKAAFDFVDFLHAAGQSCWQLLPIGPTGYGDSPYQSFSSFAGNPYFIDLDALIADGLLTQSEVEACDWGDDAAQVDYAKIYSARFAVLQKAFVRGWPAASEDVRRFAAASPRIADYALFMALKEHFGGKPWLEWPEEAIRRHRPDAVARWREKLAQRVDFYCYIQYLFFEQWAALRGYAHARGIRLVGDMPIYVALDSADIWAEPQFFQLDEKGYPTEVAGVPPDYFSADGQLWGNPLYDYDAMAADGFGWWIRRIEGAAGLFDVLRIDHFRGMESYWAVPYGAANARGGRWRKGPGMALVGVLTQWFSGLEIIAEDLGILTPAVYQLLKESGLPGMRVLQFGFGGDATSTHLPHNHVPGCVCYVGTHDNATLLQWLHELDAPTRRHLINYFGREGMPALLTGMLRACMGSVADLAIIQMQDWLRLGKAARMNTPGVAAGNWCWRMLPGAADEKLAKYMRGLSIVYGRFTPPPAPEEDGPAASDKAAATAKEDAPLSKADAPAAPQKDDAAGAPQPAGAKA